jgi:GT2 family glycosyltransferase
VLPEETRIAGGTIYVLLPVHDRRPITEAFVRCLLDQTDQGFHLVLIDDGSTDGTADAVTGMLPTATVLSGSGSWWWAGSLQQGQRWLAKRRLGPRDLVLMINDDTRFEPDFLAKARAALAGTQRTLLLARMFEEGSGAFVELGVHVKWRPLRFRVVDDPARVNCLPTRGLFMNAAEFVRLGGFHPHLLPHYLSDYAFTIRAFRRGFTFMTEPEIMLWNDLTTTGVQTSRRSAGDFLRSTLTRRSPSNPVYWTTFILLMSPRRGIPRNLFNVWRGYISGLGTARRGGA